MKDIADDLLDELEELEKSSDQLESQVNKAITNQKTLEQMPTPGTLNASAFMLETSKIAQEAAAHCQAAADANLKMATEQKLQVEDLNDISASVRQALRTGNHELKSSKNFFISLFSLTLLISIIFIGILSWLLLETQNEQTQFKNEVQDLLKIESTLNQRQINLKIDELASLLERISSNNAVSASQPIIEEDLNLSKNETLEGAKPNEIAATKPIESTQPTNQTSLQSLESVQTTLDQALTEYKKLFEDIAKLQHNQTDPKFIANSPLDLKPIEQRLAKIETLITAQTAQIQRLQKQMDAKPAPATASASKEKSSPDNQMAMSLNNQLENMKKQLQDLNTRQDDMSKNLQQLTAEFQKSLDKKDSKPSPYSYRNPYEYKE